MLQTIEVQIDTNGFIHTVDPIKQLPAGRGLLTLLGNQGGRSCKKIFLSVHCSQARLFIPVVGTPASSLNAISLHQGYNWQK